MVIGLDWDDTYTRDPVGWRSFINMMSQRGHKVYIVTWRDDEWAKEIFEELEYGCVDYSGVYATDRKAKSKFMYDKGIRIDVWIDDNPFAVLHDMGGAK